MDLWTCAIGLGLMNLAMRAGLVSMYNNIWFVKLGKCVLDVLRTLDYQRTS